MKHWLVVYRITYPNGHIRESQQMVDTDTATNAVTTVLRDLNPSYPPPHKIDIISVNEVFTNGGLY